MSMKPPLSRALESSANILSEGAYAHFLSETLPIYRRDGLSGVMRELLDRASIRVECVQQENPEFLLMRNRLNSKPGLVISNHPGYIDVPVVLQAIKRKDIKAMVTEKRYDQLTELYGDHFIAARHDMASARKAIDEIVSHIQGGGIFLLFPSGRDEMKYSDRGFQSGFRVLVERLIPQTMIYVFNVSSQDIQQMMHQEKNNPLARLVRMRTGMHGAPRFSIRLDEAYTTCEEWQGAAASAKGSFAKNQALTKQYYDLFSGD